MISTKFLYYNDDDNDNDNDDDDDNDNDDDNNDDNDYDDNDNLMIPYRHRLHNLCCLADPPPID